jgi:hypothetical protein
MKWPSIHATVAESISNHPGLTGETIMYRSFLSVVGLVALLAAASPAQAQYFNYNPYAYGHGYYNPYGYNYYGRAGGFLIGASSVIDSSGQLQVTTQQAKLMQQQTKQEKIRTQRQAFDEYRYEQMLTPTLEEKRRYDMEQELRRSQNDPPLTEIWSAKALNDLLKDLQKLQNSAGAYAPTTPIDPATLKHINVTNGTTEGGNTKLLREGKTKWPLALKSSSFEKQRQKIDKLLPEAIQQAKGGEVDDETLTSLIATVKAMDKNLRSQVADISSTDYVRAKRYITELESATKVLQDPNVANYFGKWSARGNSVAELVKHMTDNGLQFAPAGQGDQAAYTSLHRSMATYDVALSNQVRGPQVAATYQGKLITPAPQSSQNP